MELFADNGLSVMTGVFFPGKPFNHLQIKNDKASPIKNFLLVPLKSIW
ncbi:MAG: hypothetical protein ACXVB0_12870 [Mucilaginibacter sp.]